MYGNLGRDAYPPQLLDDYLRIARRRGDALPVTALRTRSLAARLLLAHAVAGASVSLAQLVIAARRRRPGSLTWEQVDAAALTDLARVVALQDLLPDDRSDGLALYDLALEMLGPDAMSLQHQGLHAQLAFDLGERERAAALVANYPAIPAEAAQDLGVDLLNPFAGPKTDPGLDWLGRFQRLLPEPYPRLTYETGITPFDRLAATAPTARSLGGGPRVTVVVPTHPGPELFTAVRSLVEQSWVDLEILLVDSGSSTEFDVALKQCLALDSRISLLKLDDGGVGAGRNAGLDAAAGEFVTFQEPRDWSHPRRIEHQLLPLLESEATVGTVTDGLQVTDDLIVTRPGWPHRVSDPASLMLRRQPVLHRVGYFDRAGEGGEEEYLQRIGAAFGVGALRRLRGEAYTLIRRSPDSPLRTESQAHWLSPARAAYVSAYRLWHQQIRRAGASPYLPKGPAIRRFPPPYDVVVVDDWRHFGGPQESMLEEIVALTDRGLRVGMAQLEALRFMTAQRHALCRPIQELINDGTVGQVLLTDDVDVSLLVIPYPPVLQFAASQPSGIRARQVVIVGDQTPSESDGAGCRHVPQTCTDLARALFAVDPLWCPPGTALRDLVAGPAPREPSQAV